MGTISGRGFFGTLGVLLPFPVISRKSWELTLGLLPRDYGFGTAYLASAPEPASVVLLARLGKAGAVARRNLEWACR